MAQANYTGTPVGGQGGASVNFKDSMNLTTERSRFNQPYLTNTTGDFGMLIPIHMQDLIPSDHVKVNIEALMRLAPMIRPTMHPIDLYAYTFAVARRILVEDFMDFYRGGESGDEVIAMPTIDDIIYIISQQQGVTMTEWITNNIELFQEESLWDYMGLPIEGINGIDVTTLLQIIKEVDAMPFMAYYRTWYEYFRDQDLQNQDKYNYKLPTNGNPQNGEYFDMQQLLMLKPKAIEKDWLSTAREWQQKGVVPAIPLEGIAPINLYNSTNPASEGKPSLTLEEGLGLGLGASTSKGIDLAIDGVNPANPVSITFGSPKTGLEAPTSNVGQLIADLETALGLGVTPIAQREVLAMQHQAERMARGGNRYIDILDINFGVTIPDSVIQNPEYLGGWGTPVIISEVLKTSAGDTDLEPQGALAGHGVASGYGTMAEYHAVEPMILTVIIVAMPKTILYQGIDRFWDKKTRYDYVWPDFVSMSEAGIKRKELAVFGGQTTVEMNDIIGYQEQYYNYKTGKNKLTGKMRTSLKNWQLPLEIIEGVNDNLSEALIVWDGRLAERKQIFAVPDEPSFQLSAGLKVDIYRPLPYITIPGLETV